MHGGRCRTWPALDELKGRLIFVLTGENSEGVSYSSMYESMYPGLQGALFFTSAPYNSAPLDPCAHLLASRQARLFAACSGMTQALCNT